MELLECGTKVELKLKNGMSPFTVDINSIYKKRDEKDLVTTFAEPFMFPVEIRGKGTYYFNGHGHRAIRDGELFRAIINGKNINFGL